MELPGGLLANGQLHRDFSFKPLTGQLERIISDSGFALHSLAEQVTVILSHALHRVAGHKADEQSVRSLSSGDRQFLILQLQGLIDPSPQWLTSNCQACDEAIQFQIYPANMPVKPAGESFPQTSLTLSIGQVILRVPTGADEERMASTHNEKSALEMLLGRIISGNDPAFDISSLNNEDIDLIDNTLDEMCPQAANSASIECPYCSHQQSVAIDHYAWITRKTRQLDEDIHTLATHYHWSEPDILALPKNRRQRYLQLIEHSLGRYRADDFIQGVAG